jgi:putative CocE/NonD family hydrolase
MIEETNLTSRMRDGVVLRADAYRPDGPERVPAILVRTPYDKNGHRGRRFVAVAVARGFAVVVQDVRGRYASDGEFDAYRQEGHDGYDTVEWLASLPWCNGRVAGSGLSYPGATQWLAAVEAPPHLACIFPAMCFSSGRQFFYFGGAFDLSWMAWIATNIAPEARRRRGLPGPRTVREAREAWRRDAAGALRHVPLNSLPMFRDVAPFYYEWLDHPDDGSYWEFADIEERHDRVRVPSFNFSGWHDEGYGPIGAIRNFTGMRARGATPAARDPFLVIGPWTHGEPTPSETKVGDRDFGPDAGLDYERLVLDWCDLHARGVDRGVRASARVRVFVMGRNRWRESPVWPIDGTRTRAIYLRGGGRLAWDAPAAAESPDRYRFDPNDPVEDPFFDDGLGPRDQRKIESRPDVLVYTSEPLAEDLEVIGTIECRVWLASSAPDTDIFVRLLDVEDAGPGIEDPGGAAWNLVSPTLEVLRARYRLSEGDPEPLRPGVPVELTLRLAVTANLFRRGHRIRVHVTSSFFPHLDRNPNTGRPVPAESRLVPAENAIFHDPQRPSRILLPVVES